MKSPAERWELEELANSLTHGVGLLLSVAGLAALVVVAAKRGTAWHIVSCAVYGATLVLLYAASTLYHAVRSPRAKRICKVMDHSAIYLLIAGTYTPFTLVNLRGPWGWTLFGMVWGLALVGVLWKIWFVDHFVVVSTTVYLLMGWLVVIAVKPVITLIPAGGLALILAGGLAYTAGVGFFAWRRLPYHHTVWHAFVLAGSICHYFAVLLYVLPPRLH
jgi:hemolysin III